MRTAAELLLAFVALYPLCTAALWMAGGLLFRLLDEPTSAEEPEEAGRRVSVLIPAYNEAPVIAVSARGGAGRRTTRSWRCSSSTMAPPTSTGRPRGRRASGGSALRVIRDPAIAARPTGSTSASARRGTTLSS